MPGVAAERIVSVNGTLTEIIYALGAQERLVGVDTTSRYPHEVETLPAESGLIGDATG
jgi:iron complex transport system substrate-binding protein